MRRRLGRVRSCASHWGPADPGQAICRSPELAHQDGPSPKPTFSIASKTGRYDGATWINEPGRNAEIFIFGWRAIREQVERFDTFTPDNDPHHEHDFGSFEHDGERIFWKIDYYDRSLTNGSEDPSDPAQTTRVLTIMLASEY